ncbi:MAG: TerB family tellurite resistance protein, partial [Desulfuromonadales bacterium]
GRVGRGVLRADQHDGGQSQHGELRQDVEAPHPGRLGCLLRSEQGGGVGVLQPEAARRVRELHAVEEGLGVHPAEGLVDEQVRIQRLGVGQRALGRERVVELARGLQDLLANTFGLSPAAIAELIEYAQTQREDSSDLFQFAREINAHFSREEKADVMEGIWRVIYADGTLDKYEDALARQLATLLRLDHKDVIDRKLKVLEEIKNQGLEDGG